MRVCKPLMLSSLVQLQQRSETYQSMGKKQENQCMWPSKFDYNSAIYQLQTAYSQSSLFVTYSMKKIKKQSVGSLNNILCSTGQLDAPTHLRHPPSKSISGCFSTKFRVLRKVYNHIFWLCTFQAGGLRFCCVIINL